MSLRTSSAARIRKIIGNFHCLVKFISKAENFLTCKLYKFILAIVNFMMDVRT